MNFFAFFTVIVRLRQPVFCFFFVLDERIQNEWIKHWRMLSRQCQWSELSARTKWSPMKVTHQQNGF